MKTNIAFWKKYLADAQAEYEAADSAYMATEKARMAKPHGYRLEEFAMMAWTDRETARAKLGRVETELETALAAQES